MRLVLIIVEIHIGLARKHGACKQREALAAGVWVQFDGGREVNVWFAVLWEEKGGVSLGIQEYVYFYILVHLGGKKKEVGEWRMGEKMDVRRVE